MTGDLSRAAYDDWHDHLPIDTEANTPWHELLRRHLSFERDIADKQVLEIGCGRGGLACWIAALPRPPRRLAAADFSTVAVRRGQSYARARSTESVRWETADIQRIPHRDSTFDTVISCETIEHVPQPVRAATELARVLRHGGRLILTTPNYLGPMGLYRIYARLRGRPYTEEGQPINHVTMLPRTIWWIKRAGLEISAIDGVGHYLPIPGRPPIRLPHLDGGRIFTRWLALHSLVVAIKS
jgi:2-polyprenyl-3-methyl-5-hydroxy-6-metoxy-1,4-benzoquinol methylase